MRKQTYFLMISLFLLCLLTNFSFAQDSQKESQINQENMLINDISASNTLINNTKNNILINNTKNNNSINSVQIENNQINKISTTTKTKTSIKTINEDQFYKNKYIEVELVDSKNKRIPNTEVYMTLFYNKNTKTYKLGTNSKGIVKVEITLTVTYSVKFEFKGNSKYLASNSSKIIVIKDLDLNTIIKESSNLMKDIESDGKIPETIKINKTNYTTEEFLYLMAKAISNINKKDKSSLKLKYIDEAPSPNSKELSGKIYKDEYLKMTQYLLEFMNDKSRAPNYVSSKLGNIPYKQVVHIYSKILDFYKKEKRLCNYVTVEKLSTFKKTTTQKIIYNIIYSILNDKYTSGSLTKYLSASSNCQSTNSNILNIAKSLTSSTTDVYLKAKLIFNYVRDKITYSNYNNTKKGAVKTLSQKSGNCVDKTHLLVAIARAAGIPARYVHGKNCKFTSGKTCGHVWAQLLIGDTWVVADTTSSKNSLGVVKNWNINNYYLIGKSYSISF